jgi:hypothetical protein
MVPAGTAPAGTVKVAPVNATAPPALVMVWLAFSPVPVGFCRTPSPHRSTAKTITTNAAIRELLQRRIRLPV